MAKLKSEKGKSVVSKKLSGNQLSDYEKEAEELRNRIKYMRADFENYKKHVDSEKTKFENISNERLITGILQTVDDLERSVSGIDDEKTKTGIKMIYDSLMKTLGKFGLRRIDALGRMFDPYYHEAMLSEKSKKADGTVIAELMPGYTLNSKVMRHSKVTIAKS